MPLIAFQFRHLGWLTVIGWVWFSDGMSRSGDAFQRVNCQVSESLKQSLGYQILRWTLFQCAFHCCINTRGLTLLYVSGSAVMWNNLLISVVSFYSRLPVAGFTPSPRWSPDTCVGNSFQLQSHSVVQYTEIISIDGRRNTDWLVNLISSWGRSSCWSCESADLLMYRLILIVFNPSFQLIWPYFYF